MKVVAMLLITILTVVWARPQSQSSTSYRALGMPFDEIVVETQLAVRGKTLSGGGARVGRTRFDSGNRPGIARQPVPFKVTTSSTTSTTASPTIISGSSAPVSTSMTYSTSVQTSSSRS